MKCIKYTKITQNIIVVSINKTIKKIGSIKKNTISNKKETIEKT